MSKVGSTTENALDPSFKEFDMNRVFRSSHAVTLGALALLAVVLVPACMLSAHGTNDGDQGGANSLCDPGARRACYTGPTGTSGIGICVAGTQVCNEGGTAFGECLGVVLPRVEDCATAASDEDCDGKAPPCTGAPVGVGFAGNGATGTSDMGFGVATNGTMHVVVGVKGSGVTNYNVGDGELYVAMFDQARKVVWQKSYSSPGGYAVGRSVALDALGNIVVAGEFQGTLTIGNKTLESGNSINAFVAKFKTDGELLWAADYGDETSKQVAYGVTVNEAGEVFVTGTFSGDIDFGKGVLSADGRDVFVAKLGPNGDGAGPDKWAKQLGGSDGQIGWSIAAGRDGSVVVAGEFETNLNFGGGTLPNAGGRDVFVAKLRSDNGDGLWQKAFGDGADQIAYSVSVGANGDVVVGGEFIGTMAAGEGMEIDSAGAADAFVINLAKDGTPRWAKGFGGSGDQLCEGVAVDASGHVLMLGHFDGSIAIGSSNYNSAGEKDIFVTKLAAADGAPLWSRSFGNTEPQRAWSVAVEPQGNALATGAFAGSVHWGEPVGSATSAGKYDLFLLEFAP
jgi:hypothetical protein